MGLSYPNFNLIAMKTGIPATDKQIKQLEVIVLTNVSDPGTALFKPRVVSG
jgi:hypothetical protein